jgi:small subunit ribosomal protein S17
MPIKERVGVVVSDLMNKTIVVSVQNRITHKKYGKVISRTKTYKAHDESNNCRIGDLVIIQETRPLSKTKRWMLKSVKQQVSHIDISNTGD